MDLLPSDEQQQLVATLRRLLDRRLAAVVDALPDAPAADPAQLLDDARQVGLLGLGLPEDAGGAGTFADLTAAHVELGRGLAAPLLTALSLATRLAAHAADAGGLLPALADAAVLASPAVDDTDGTVTALDDRDGELRLTGRKWRVVGGPAAEQLLVAAAAASADRRVLVSVPVGAPGLDWAVADGSDGAEHWTVGFDRTPVTAEQVLGAVDIDRYLLEAAVLAAARQVGGGRAVTDRTVEHVRTRVQFDRPIGSFQAVQHQLADVATDLDATDLAVAQAAWAIDTAQPRDTIERCAGIAALSAAEAFRRATLVAHQLHGGMGFVLDSPLHLWSARAVCDPTVPLPRRDVLDRLATATGIAEDGTVTAPADHRQPSR